MPARTPLGPSDVRLLRALQENGRASIQDLAEIAGLSTSTCWRRVRELEAAGVIGSYRAVVNAEACGLDFEALVQVVLSRHEPDKLHTFVDAISRRAEVLDCYATTGDADYHLRVCCRNKEDYYRFLEEFLFRIPVVAKVTSNLVLKEIKRNTPLPLD